MSDLPTTWELIAPAVLCSLGTAGAVVYAEVKFILVRYIHRFDDMEESLNELKLEQAVMRATLNDIKNSMPRRRLTMNDTFS